MKAIILAAGRGSRLKQHTEDCPKGLVKLCGVSLVERMIGTLRAAGISEIAIVTGYRKESFDFLNMPTFHNPIWDQTNMVQSLACAKEWLQEGPIIVSYSDIFLAPSVVEKLMEAKDCPLAMTYDQDWLSLWEARNENVLDDAETFRLNGHIVTEIGNKATAVEEIEGQYMGLFKLTPQSWQAIEDLLADIPVERAMKLSVTEMFQLLIEREIKIQGVPVSGQWGEVDTETDLILYEKFAAQRLYGSWFYACEEKKGAA